MADPSSTAGGVQVIPNGRIESSRSIPASALISATSESRSNPAVTVTESADTEAASLPAVSGADGAGSGIGATGTVSVGSPSTVPGAGGAPDAQPVTSSERKPAFQCRPHPDRVVRHRFRLPLPHLAAQPLALRSQHSAGHGERRQPHRLDRRRQSKRPHRSSIVTSCSVACARGNPQS